MLRGGLCLLLALLPAGCIVGGGDGWVGGDLWLAQCNGSDPLEAQDGSFDLKVNFFAAESLMDSNPAAALQRNRLTIRLQNTSNNIEVSDGLMLQFLDVGRAARLFAAGEPLAVSASGLCAGTCAASEDLVRARLYLYTSCPDAREGLVATSRSFATKTPDVGGSCLAPSSAEAPACPALSASARASLEALCQGDFNNREGQEVLRSTLGAGGGACIHLCEFGEARRGQDPNSLSGFAIDYGERISALFSLRILDGRAIETASCTDALGQIQGMFRFEVSRGLAAQTFP